MATDVTEREARQVAEEAREGEWKLPELRQGPLPRRLRLDLIHPQPQLDPAAVEKGERSSPSARLPHRARRPAAIERDAKIPDEVIDGLKELGALGHEGARAVRRPRALAGVLQPRADARGLVALVAVDAAVAPTSRSASPSRCCCSAPRSRSSEWLPLVAAHAHLRVPADRARRRLGPRPARHDRHADRGRHGYRLNGAKLWATNGAIADIVVVMAKVPKARAPRRHHRVRAAVRRATASRSSTATRSWACAGSRTP